MDKPVLAIVGMGPGVSFGVAQRFGKEGFQIAMVARKPGALFDLQHRLNEAGIEAHAVAADAASESELHLAFNQIRTHLGPPDVLLYNAYGHHRGAPSALNPHDLVDDLRVNVVGAMVAAQHVLPHMRARRHGTLLFTGGGFALEPQPAMASLGIGKAALRSLVQSLAKELSPEGIRVATVTICGMVQNGTALAPERIAEEFYRLHKAGPGAEAEVVLR